jgi:hypothetical protein
VTRERGQASLMSIATVGLLVASALVVFAFGNALGANASRERAPRTELPAAGGHPGRRRRITIWSNAPV